MKTLSPFPQAWVTTILHSVAMNGTTWDSPYKWTHAVFVSLWLGDCTRLNVHTVTQAGIAFHVKAAPLYVMYRMWFLHSSILNTCMSSTSWLCGNELGRANTYLFPTCSHSFELYLEVKLLNHMVVLFLMVILFSIVVFPFNNPIHTAQGFPFLHILASTCNFLTFYTSLLLLFFL